MTMLPKRTQNESYPDQNGRNNPPILKKSFLPRPIILTNLKKHETIGPWVKNLGQKFINRWKNIEIKTYFSNWISKSFLAKNSHDIQIDGTGATISQT